LTLPPDQAASLEAFRSAQDPAICALLSVGRIGSLPFVTADADHAVEILVDGATTAATLSVRTVRRDPGQQPDVSLS
jgi:hypothetical protein